MSFLGAILPAWGYHLRPSFTEVGDYFLVLALGLLLSVGASHVLLPRRGLKFILVLASLLACGGLERLIKVGDEILDGRHVRFGDGGQAAQERGPFSAHSAQPQEHDAVHDGV